MRNTNNQDNRTDKRKLGDIGENCACEFLLRRGYEIVERNYLRKWGELDIVARKGKILHFIEVKSARLNDAVGQVSGVTSYRPEENLHPGKLLRLSRIIQTYLLHPPERLFSRAGKKQDIEWQLDLITARIDIRTRQARVEMIENIIL